MANNTKRIEEMVESLTRLLPPGMKSLRTELRENFRAVLRAKLERLDLVSRERFDVQADLLARTQAKLEALEARLAKIEKKKG
jgi:BMFP domain-containing protein YqiC